MHGCLVQEDNITQADTLHDPFIECYRAWMHQKQFSSGTGADFLASFSNTSGASHCDDESPCPPVMCRSALTSSLLSSWADQEQTMRTWALCNITSPSHILSVLATQAWHPSHTSLGCMGRTLPSPCGICSGIQVGMDMVNEGVGKCSAGRRESR